MQKEPLTIEKIRHDLRGQIRDGLIFFGLCIIFLVLFSFLSIKMLQERELIVILLGFMLVFLLILTIVQAICVYKRYYALNNPDCIVKERLGRKEIKYQLRKNRPNEFYCLYFPGHRAYEIPGENYEWSELYYLSGKMVYTYADCGDEFYLVLSKPHTGKILLAYNAKMFDYQETPCNPTHPGV